jgi:DNA replication protein DnaC
MHEEFEEKRKNQEKLEREARIRSQIENPENFMGSSIPKKFLGKSLDNFDGAEQIKKVCYEYIDGFSRDKRTVKSDYEGGEDLVVDYGLKSGGSILLIGKTGCGKTHLAISIYKELVRRFILDGYRSKFTTAPELLLEIRATYRPSSKKYSDDGGRCEAETEQEVLDNYSTCEFLILDDLGAEKVSDFTIQSLYLIIDRRNREMRPTIVTTNLSLEEIETQIDARMASRLADMTIIKLTMPDYRKKR